MSVVSGEANAQILRNVPQITQFDGPDAQLASIEA